MPNIAIAETADTHSQSLTSREQATRSHAIDVTVAIPTYNGAERLPKLLDRLRLQVGLDHIQWEIIVCDNGSTDETAAVIEQYQRQWQKDWPAGAPLHYRFAAEQGAAFARQYGVESACGDLIAFLDDDNLPDSNWVAQACQFAQSYPQAGAVGSQIHGQFETELPAELENIQCFLAIIERGDEPCLYEPAKKILPPAAGLVVRKQAWLEAVPERLFLNNKGKEAGLASEDLEAILHIQKAGWDIWYNPDMVIHHDIPDGRLKKDYLVTLFRCVGLSCFHIRLLGIERWKRPFAIPAYIANDIRKLALHRMRHGQQAQLSTTDSCKRELLKSSVISPVFLLKKAYQDAAETHQDSKHQDQKQWLAQISQAFEKGQFTLYQQPVMAVNPSPGHAPTNQNEVLLRLHNDHNEYISPNRFLPTAKRYGLMRTIDRWVIRQLFCKVEQESHLPDFNQTIAHLGGSPLYSINLSTASIKDASLAKFIAGYLTRIDLPPSLFCFEISAGTALNEPQATATLIKELRQLGCQITLDNVTLSRSALGTKVDSLIDQLPLDFIKLSSGLIDDRLFSVMRKSAANVIAKGIESQAVLETVQAQGIGYVQGYQVGRPRPL